MTTEQQWFADRFAEQRPRLRAVAYRMLGSVTEAEDALQEAWIRTTRSDSSGIDNLDGWLTTLVSRVCIDMLRARQARPETPTERLPEPVIVADGMVDDPEHAALVADSVGLALLVVLESLDPAERVALVLHDMFGVPFDEIAPIVERTPVAARQLASRARRHVRATAALPDADLPTQRRVAEAFLAAARAGDFEALLRVLDPEVVFRADTGARAWLAPARLNGAEAVAEHTATHGRRYAGLCRLATVNGAVGIIARNRSSVVAVAGFTVIGERIAEIDLILDPDRLAGLTIRQ